MTELQMQAQCAQWYWNMYRFTSFARMLHCNDNNSINRLEGNKKKALGVIPGVSDFEFIAYGVVWFIELKLPGGVQSDEQKEFEAEVTKRGQKYIIIFSFVDFKKLILQLIAGTI